jgi:gluconolactonase
MNRRLLVFVLFCACDDDRSPDASILADATPDAGIFADAAVFADAEPLDSGVAVDPTLGLNEPALIQGGFLFTEGPTWRAAEGVLLFSDINANTIYRFDPTSGIAPFRMPSNRSNGLASDRDGLLLACEHESRRVSRTLSDGTVVAIAERFEGGSLNSPNDLAVRSDNTIYFTDPPFGLGNRMREVDFNGVYRIDPSGMLFAEWRGERRTRPNGVALSPDERILYVAESADEVLIAFDVAADGSLSNERVFTQTGGVGDGMAVDDAGNIYLTTIAGIEVYAPDGSRWGVIAVPVQPANVAFGGAARRTLYITSRAELYQLEMPIPGGN